MLEAIIQHLAQISVCNLQSQWFRAQDNWESMAGVTAGGSAGNELKDITMKAQICFRSLDFLLADIHTKDPADNVGISNDLYTLYKLAT